MIETLKVHLLLLCMLLCISTLVACNSDSPAETTNDYSTEDAAPIAPIEHQYSKWTTVKAATCTEQGVEECVCSICGEKNTRTTQMLQHNYGDWSALKNATCTETGTQVRACSLCGDEETEVTAMLPHTYGNWETLKNATCSEKGVKERTCSCGKKENLEDDLLPHSFYYEITVKAPTETEKGEREHICEDCGYIEATELDVLTYKTAEGLEYKLSGDVYYIMSIGSCTDTAIIIPSTYNGKTVVGINRKAFAGASLVSVIIPDSITSIDEEAFRGCRELTSIMIPDSVTSIGTSAFAGCVGLASVNIPTGVTTINMSVFSGCWSLKQITFPDSLTKIGHWAFTGCRSLSSIFIPKNVSTIDTWAFSECSNLEQITVAEENTIFHSAGNCLIETADKALAQGCKNSVIPSDESVVFILSSSFQGCTGLKSIVIPDGVTFIGDRAFEGCTALTTVMLPETLKTISEKSFANCYCLSDVYYAGTESDWNNIVIYSDWSQSSGNYFLHFNHAQ